MRIVDVNEFYSPTGGGVPPNAIPPVRVAPPGPAPGPIVLAVAQLRTAELLARAALQRAT